jgi:hypothetical protein
LRIGKSATERIQRLVVHFYVRHRVFCIITNGQLTYALRQGKRKSAKRVFLSKQRIVNCRSPFATGISAPNHGVGIFVYVRQYVRAPCKHDTYDRLFIRGELFQKLHELLEYFDLSGEFTGDLVKLYLFVALGGGFTIFGAFKKK